ncbi:MAG: hypothetical protein CVU11_10920 [Bacteroidetes bacterium HGW-Bacteroidetes-6]|jgi:hypothetical protein|nr:MAG: hypothetical protein CVU11_10920 [Bacteroidetes bacterium HGW-Bacteroidetes-6]
MKRNILSLIFIFSITYAANAQYVINFANPATYQVTCGSTTPSQWSVSKSTCDLYLPPFVLASVSNFTVNYTFKINQSGNLTTSDALTVFFKKGAASAWITDTVLLGNVDNNVRTFSKSINISSSDTLFFKVEAHSVNANGFWAIKSGDINIGNVVPIYFPLPIELAEFKGYHNTDKNVNHLTWTTITEVNNSYFTLEKSTDGINYETVVVLPGAGNSNMPINYEFIDKAADYDYYYRLTQTDFDGKFEVFYPVFIKKTTDNSLVSLIDHVWFNGSSVVVKTLPGSEGNLNIDLLASDGRIISNNIVSDDGYGSEFLIDDASVKSGQFLIIRVSDKNGNQNTAKLVTP